MYRRDGLNATVMQLGQSLWDTFEDEAESSRSQTFHRPHRSVIFYLFTYIIWFVVRLSFWF